MSEAPKTAVDDKRVAVIMAAVTAHIKTEELAVATAQAWALEQAAPAPQVKPWGLSGRQAQMQQRTLMHLRAFR